MPISLEKWKRLHTIHSVCSLQSSERLVLNYCWILAHFVTKSLNLRSQVAEERVILTHVHKVTCPSLVKPCRGLVPSRWAKHGSRCIQVLLKLSSLQEKSQLYCISSVDIVFLEGPGHVRIDLFSLCQPDSKSKKSAIEYMIWSMYGELFTVIPEGKILTAYWPFKDRSEDSCICASQPRRL